MNLSLRRSKKYRDDIESSRRENDFMFQRLFEASRKSGRSSDPSQFWLDHLLYLLETSHEDLLTDAEKTDHNALANTYKYFIESYALQIWKAADGYEFFLSDGMVDFEGDTQSFLGTKVKETGIQLRRMTTDDLIHLILPINPGLAVIFCNESRCWESPFVNSMQNRLLKNAPHKDIINVHIPIRRSARFERARRELEVFRKKNAKMWKSQGIRFDYQDTQQQHEEEDGPPSQEQIARIVRNHMSALDEAISMITTKPEPMQRTKDNALKSWLAIRALEAYRMIDIATPSPGSDCEAPHFSIMHPALKAAFEATYPPKYPDYRDLVTVDFSQFICYGIGDETFVQLPSKIDTKIRELVHADIFRTHWKACATTLRPPEGSISQVDEDPSEEPTCLEKDLLRNPAFQSTFRAAQGFDVLK